MPVKITGDVDIPAAENVRSLDGQLLDVARAGTVDAARQLVAKGADINTVGEDGYTPLHEAVHANKPDMAALLIELGASVKVKEKRGLTPMDLAERYDRQQVIQRMKHALSLRNGRRMKALRQMRPRFMG